MFSLVPLRGSLRAAAATAALACAFALAAPGSAHAAPGDLDTSFGSGGRVVVDTARYEDGQDVAIDPDGRIVTVGTSFDDNRSPDFSVMRHRPDGSRDTSFGGGDGEAVTDFEGGDDRAQGVAVEPDGQIVVVGRTEWWPDESGGCCWFTIARYNTDGTIDTGFGESGRVIPQLAGGAEDAWAVTVQPDGKILAAGSAGGTFALVRLNPDGSPDTTFGGGDGEVMTSFPGGAQGNDMALMADGRIVVIGYAGETSFDFALARYRPDGSLDPTFDGDGRVVTNLGGYDWGEAVVVQPNGRIVASGQAGDDFTVVRYHTDGTRDTAFGTGGVATTDFGTGAAVRDLALQSDGRILAAGTAGNDFAVARYNPDGSPDTGFGTGGRTTTDFGGADVANALTLQSDGRIVVFGNTDDDRALARYLGGGTPPSPADADVSVTKSGTATVTISDRVTYRVTVTNTSNQVSATGVSLTDTLGGPAATVISATAGQGSCTTTATGATCALGTLAPGASTTVTVVAEPRATGTLTNRATVTTTTTDPVSANNATTATTTVNNNRGCTRIGTSGNDTLNGTSGNDVICALSGNDTVNAGYGNDTVYGNHGNDRLDGGFHDDALSGGPGDDNLIGYYGNDRLNTVDNVSGNDTANGGPGTDSCTTDSGDTRLSCS